jgi:hypothetical protein
MTELQTYDFYKDARQLSKYKTVWDQIRDMKMKLSMLACKLPLPLPLHIVNKKSSNLNLRSNTMILLRDRKKRPCVVHDDNKFILIWDTFVNILYILSFIIIPLMVASNLTLLEHMYFAEFVVDLILFIDMILTFFKTYNDDIKKVTSLRLISVKYLSSYFVFDFLSIVPGLVTYEQYELVYYFKLFRYFQLERLFEQIQISLGHLSAVLSSINRKVVSEIVSVTRAIFLLLFLVHTLA